MKKIGVIHTGGTISMHMDSSIGAVVPSDQHPLKQENHLLKSYAHIVEFEPFHLPSPHVTPNEMLHLSLLIKEIAISENLDGVIITHGTDTLEETAYFLDLALHLDIPIILTGAMRSSNEIGADGIYNLISSIRVAIHPDSKGKGVLVVMNDEIHSAQNVTKTSTSNVSTFQSPQYGPIGLITKEDIHFHHMAFQHQRYEVESLHGNVFLLKTYAGMESALLDAVIQLPVKGIVIEGLGQGNVPPSLVPGIIALRERHVPVIMVSRCYNGIAQPVYGYLGGGKMLEQYGVRFEHGLSGPKARIKLLLEISEQHTGFKK
ncbi:asparaginase [Paenisporosarcina cavernae]|uniref:asparaginase n=1 Tax=Paenisporosarcina cavernae TaxID=2320858 RepID=A0A385YST7_9BACL|nr:asparaginase [Paenisporosarcina cavernae]AYC29370.1 asparaginase [Paenisporosarcina cavernae]